MEMRDYKAEFRACEERLSDIHGLKELFDIWKKAQDIEIDELESSIAEKQAGYGSGNKKSEKEIFETEMYGGRGKKNCTTISSHFMKDFQVDIWGEKIWTQVLKNAFKPDGCVGTFQIPEQGYAYIFLLKEANDSKGKSCRPEDYPDEVLTEGKINEWLQDWIAGKPGEYRLLNRLLKVMQIQPGNENLSKEEFVTSAAYMNVNKRGGTSSTRGRDETSVLNYAGRYQQFILKEICLLAGKRPKVKVFAAGSYFKKLMTKLEITEPLNYRDKESGKRIEFVHITHPSAQSFLSSIRN